jgi:hypothetical protein
VKSTTRFNQNKRGIICLNCEQPISDKDNFCSNCGQVNDELPLSIKQFVSEFFSGFFSFDTRFFNTFIPLLFKPGKVSKDYVEGKRRRYVNPFQLYLHITIVFFLLQGLFSALDEYKISGSFSKNSNKIVTDSILKTTDSIISKTNKTLDQTKKDLAEKGINVDLPIITNNDSINEKITDSIFKKYNIPITKKSKNDSILNSAKQKIKAHIDSIFNATNILERLKNNSLTVAQKDSIFDKLYDSTISYASKLLDTDKTQNWEQIEGLTALKKYAMNYIEEVFKFKNIDYILPEKTKTSVEDEIFEGIMGKSTFKKVSGFMEYDKNHKDISVVEALDDLGYKKTRWNIFYYKKAQDLNRFKNDSEFRSSYLDDVISKISIALFFMLPIFTWFISLLYFRHKKNYTEHLVFVFNIQTVFFILLIFFTIFDRIFKTDIGIGLFFLVFLFYLYKSMRNFYKQNRFKTIVKYFMLNTIFVILSTIGGAIISFLAFAL